MRHIVDRRLGRQGVKLLYAVPWPPEGLFTKRKISAFTDFKEMKFAAGSKRLVDLARALRAEPVEMPLFRLQKPDAQAQVDVVLASANRAIVLKLGRTFKFYNEIASGFPRNAVVINLKRFDSLPSDIQRKIIRIARETEEKAWARSKEFSDKHVKKLREQGIEVISPDPQLRRKLISVGSELTTSWAKFVGPDGKEVFALREKLVR